MNENAQQAAPAAKPARAKRPLSAEVDQQLRDLADLTKAPGSRLGVFLTRMRTLACDAQEALDGIGDVNLARVFGEGETMPVHASLALAISIQVGERPARRVALVLKRGAAEPVASISDAPAVPGPGEARLDTVIELAEPEASPAPPEEARPIRMGDLVKYTGSGASALDGGPGKIVALSASSARVKVQHGCVVLGNPVLAGETLTFARNVLAPAQ